ncbi:hypothetical protein MRX96_040389 [Rhipicephalus microplus]
MKWKTVNIRVATGWKPGVSSRKQKAQGTITGEWKETSQIRSPKVATYLLSSIPIHYPNQDAWSGWELEPAADQQGGGDSTRGDPNNIPP